MFGLPTVLAVFALVVISVGVFITIAKCFHRVSQGTALIITRFRKPEPDVTFTGGVVFPVFNKAELMDISVKTIEIDRRGKEGLICEDNIRADIKVNFFVRISKTREDVIKVAQAIGCARASDPQTLEVLFSAKFSEALKTVGKQLKFIDLYTKREEFRDQIIRVIGRDLNGYALEDAAIDYLEQTPLSVLDRDNILDAQGIRKITELTAIEHISTNESQNNEKKQIKRQDVDAAEKILELERSQAEVTARTKKEIDQVQAREQAEAMKVQAEERQKAELARIKADESIGVADQNRAREVEVAERNRARVVGVETERAEKDRQLEAISREREVELQRIEKERQLEIQKKAIADVIRERVSVERTVAEEEEKIKGVRVIEDANRTGKATVVLAEADAQKSFVSATKQAEAQQEIAKFKAKERIVMAEAELEAADRDAKASIRRAEGEQALAAASGLATVKVKEADAIATEKLGMATVRVKEADAGATEKMGLAQARVKEADAGATEKVGFIEAKVRREKGDAEAFSIEKKWLAEATGIQKKAEAIQTLDPASRAHEEFRLALDAQRELGMSEIKARQAVASSSAQVLSDGLKNAKVDIISSEPILDRVVGAVSMAKGLDAGISRSESLQHLFADYAAGKASLSEDLKAILTKPSIGAQDLRDLTLSALLARIATSSDEENRAKLDKLVEAVKRLGVGDVKVS